jgi:hypothetical protein
LTKAKSIIFIKKTMKGFVLLVLAAVGCFGLGGPKLGCIGDSITQGGCNVLPNQTYVAQLAALLPEWNIVNFGVSGMTMLTNGLCGASKPQIVRNFFFFFVFFWFLSFLVTFSQATARGLARLRIPIRWLPRQTFTRSCWEQMTANSTIGLECKTIWETATCWTISSSSSDCEVCPLIRSSFP